MSAPGASGVNNFADRVLRNRIDRADEPAAYSIWQGRIMEQLTWGTLASDVADCRNSMLRLGVSPGDRIVAQMATGSAALTAFFAAASIGAVWSTVPVGDNLPEVLRDPERTPPKVVFCVDGFRRSGTPVYQDVAEIVALCALSGTHVVLVGDLDPDANVSGAIDWGRLFVQPGVFDVAAVTADHGLCQQLSPSGARWDSPLVTHGAAATAALHSLAGAPDVRHDSVVTGPAAVGSSEWLRLLGVLSLGVTIVLSGPDDPTNLDRADRLIAAVTDLPFAQIRTLTAACGLANTDIGTMLT